MVQKQPLVKRVLILVNHEVVIYNFRRELVERLINDGYETHISTPLGERVEKLREMGAIIHPISFDRHGMNPKDEIAIYRAYKRLMRDISPSIVLAYTIKPDIYGAVAARKLRIPFVASITGLGIGLEKPGFKRQFFIQMYRYAFGTRKSKIQRVFFQNEENEQFFKEAGIALDKHKVIPGSGVNLIKYPFYPYPAAGDGKIGEPIRFAFIGRILKEKGIDDYLAAAEQIKEKYPNTEFYVCGFFEPEYDSSGLMNLSKKGIVTYEGNIEDVSGFMSRMHCIIHPTYYPEGLSNVLLEASSTGRPVISTDRAGCREVCRDGINGYTVKERNVEDLVEKIQSFIELDLESKKAMGQAGRKMVEKYFDRMMVVEAYLKEVEALCK